MVNAQISKFNTKAWGFELDSIKWPNRVYNSYPEPNDIVEAWSVEYGFTRSSEFAHTGKYSLKVDYLTHPVPNDPRIQTTRGEDIKVGNFDILAPGDYTVSMWAYIVGKPSGVIRLIGAKRKDLICVAAFDFENVVPNKWTLFTYDFVVTPETIKEDLYGILYFKTYPKDCIIYIDDILFAQKKKTVDVSHKNDLDKKSKK